MKKIIIAAIFIVIILTVYFFAQKRDELSYVNENSSKDNEQLAEQRQSGEPYLKSKKEIEREKEGKEILKSPDELYRKAIGLDKIKLSQAELQQKWAEILSRPGESNEGGDSPYDTWTCLGPYSLNWPSTSYKFNGRVTDLEFEGLPSLRVASSTGGLWKYLVIGFITLPIAMSDAITSLNIGAVATNPLDTNTIFIGTGEIPTQIWGTGMWKTSNGGTNWGQVNLPINPGGFYRIKYRPGSSSVIHSICEQGYLRSDAGGNSGTWTLRESGNVSDIAINNSNSDIIYITKYGLGLYKSTNGGNSFSQVTTIPVSPSDWGRASIGIASSDPNYIYVVVAKPGAGSIAGVTKGIYKTTNNGTTWSDVSWRDGGGTVIDFHWNQGNYGNCIGVCPTNKDIVLVGGGSVLRTSNGGVNWFESSSSFMAGIHVDQHAIKWHSDGQRVYIGNDGGVNYSSNQGITWNTAANILPTVQFYGFSSGVLANNIILVGGLQDNSTAVSINNGTTWYSYNGGDGWDAVVDKDNPMKMFSHNNSYFVRTTNGGINWDYAGTGLNTSYWVSNFEDDGSLTISPFIYVGNSTKVFYSANMGSTFQPFTTASFNTPVWRITSTSLSTGATVLYAILWNIGSPNQNDVLRVYDGGTWYDRGAGLPLTPLRFVCPHPRNSSKAYAITEYYGSTQKVFKTTNRGINWQNVTGDLPDIPVMDVVPHPTNDNILYLGSDYGTWRTTNAGSNWQRWTNGMPIANKITEFEYIDSVSVGKFYIMASSHGRGIWIRDASSNDPVAVNNENSNVPLQYSLEQNYPNPFNPATKIKFSLPSADYVELKVYDVLGHEVATIINQKIEAGNHESKFNARDLATGVYFYRITTSRFTDVKKMILVK